MFLTKQMKFVNQQFKKKLQLYNIEDICKIAIKKNIDALQHVHNQTEYICKEAVKQNGSALQYVHNQTDDICKLAVQQYGYVIQYVHNQTPEICKLVVQKNPNARWWLR